MKIWLDDIRDPPDNTWFVYRSAEELISFLTIYVSKLQRNADIALIEEISFDHDLGDWLTGYDVAKYIEEAAYFGDMPRIKWRIHSANPVGRVRIECAMKQADASWAEKENGQ